MISRLANPLRAIQSGAERLRVRRSIRRFAAEGRRRYQGDPRYDVNKVHLGGARTSAAVDDGPLLERICEAYRRAVLSPPSQEQTYGASKWWREVRSTSLGPVQRALADADLEALQGMYANFYRDSCSNGLIGLNLNISKERFLDPAWEVNRHFLLSDGLQRIDYWKALTQGREPVETLAGPDVGNPFGIFVGDTLVRNGAEQQHYCARAIAAVNPQARVIAEIGGGFGGTAYYLLRDNPRLTYVDFDVPESLALTAYFLMKSFPERRIALFGEAELSAESLETFDTILMPSFQIPKMPESSVDTTFSAHTLPDLPAEAQRSYIMDIRRQTSGFFLHVGSDLGTARLRRNIPQKESPLELVAEKVRNWNAHREASREEVELTYRIRPR